ncbi:acyl carrier protein [Pseudohongiella nitratireducens]|uniref:acyl carrier protein n=1 Tax=Pseudohongiella nitratireducens TaxID=1768907 RepID=UPI0030EF250A|tara:strand:- start:11072 stop:11308 length:237 start_codon:yes stop_codon:yes gene_type:complete
MNAEKFVVDLVVKKCSGANHADINCDSPLSSLPLGSLKVLEIVHEIESKYAIDIDEKQLFEIEKVGDLVNLVSGVGSE